LQSPIDHNKKQPIQPVLRIAAERGRPAMQCLARAVARTAAEGYAGRRFLATGRGAARSYANKQVRLATARALLRDRRSSEWLYQQRLMSERRAVGVVAGKLDSPGAVMGRRLCAILAGALLAKIFEPSVGSSTKEDCRPCISS